LWTRDNFGVGVIEFATRQRPNWGEVCDSAFC
jgi:hypothetical protein